MSRISIDVTPEQHKQLKAMAALEGMSIKEFVLSRTIEDEEVAAAIDELKRLLDSRLERARTQGFSDSSVEEIFKQARRETDG